MAIDKMGIPERVETFRKFQEAIINKVSEVEVSALEDEEKRGSLGNGMKVIQNLFNATDGDASQVTEEMIKAEFDLLEKNH